MARALRTSNGSQIVFGGAAPKFRSNALALEFGALTKAGAGAVAVSGTSITAGDPSGHWQISGGLLSPTAAAVSAGFSGAPYTLTTDAGLTYTVSCPANVRHVATSAEANAAANDGANLGGVTVKMRPGTYDQLGAYNYFRNIPTRCTFTASDAANPPQIAGLVMQGATRAEIGNVTFQGLWFHKPQVATKHNFREPIANSYVCSAIGDAGFSFIDCEVSSDVQASVNDAGLIEYMIGISIDGPGSVVQGCDIHNIGMGVYTRGAGSSITGNTIRQVFADAINVRGNSSNLTIRGNTAYDFFGFGDILHQDFVQFTDPTSGSFTDITIEGNLVFAGDFLTNNLMAPFEDKAVSTVSVTSTQTLTAASHASKQISVTGSSITLTLPPAADCPQETIWFTNGSTNSFTVTDGVSPVTVSSAQYAGTYAARSDGSAWSIAPIGYRAGIGRVTANFAGLARHDNLTFMVDATAGNITITLPPVSGMDKVNFCRVDNSGNTVTVQPSGAEVLKRRGSSVASVTIPARKAYTFLQSGGEWISYAGKYENQGIFGNVYTYSNITIRGNVLWTEASHTIRLEGDFLGHKVYNNTCLFTAHPDRDSDGVWDSFDGVFTVQSPAVRLKANSSATNAERHAANNFVAGQLDLVDGGTGTTYSQDNVVAGITPATASTAVTTLATYLAGASYYPTTVDEALGLALAKPGGALDGTYIGALGTTRSNGYWDFTTGQKNPSAPEPVIP